jgi:sugar lactone lactonase YvrE
MLISEAELIIPAKAILGEGPCWDTETGVLYWVNILDKKVNIYDPRTGNNREIQLDQMVGTIVPRESGGLVTALQNGFYFLDPDTEKLTPIHDPEAGKPENRFNDGKCDPYGRFWAGTMSLSEESRQGSLYCLDTDLKVTSKQENLTISNGLAWSPNHKYMYLIDTPTKKVTRFDYDLDTGHIENSVEVVSFPEGIGAPDGMTIDEEGMLWVAHWGGAQISRWDPATGKQLSSIPIPALNVTSCTFGGENLDELYVTTARNKTTEEDLKRFPEAGGVFKVRPGVKGLPAYTFKG